MQQHGRRALVISMMKNEGPYIIEWVAFQRVVGFDDIIVYTNDCDDGTDLMLDRLAHLGELTHVRNEVLRRGPQKSALKYARDHALYTSADWVFVCDIDEFLNIHEGAGRVEDLVARFPDADAIPVAWRMFSHGGHEALPEGLTLSAFTDAEPSMRGPGEKGRFVKTLFRRDDQIEKLGTHGPIYREGAPPRWGSEALEAEPDGDPLRPPATMAYGAAQVNHYAVRSVDAYLVKRDRGRVNHVDHDMGLDYWRRWCLGGEEDHTILRQLPALRAEIARLEADPVLRGLAQGARDWHAAKVADLRTRPDYEALRSAILAESAGTSRAAPARVAAPAALAPQRAAAARVAAPALAMETAAAAPAPLRSAPVVAPGAMPALDLEAIAERARAEVEGATGVLALKAPKRHQNRLKMLSLMPRGGRCAEIGVWNGGFSGAILEVTAPSELVLIDPWDLLSVGDPGDWTHARHEDAAFMAQMHANVTASYGAMGNVVIRRGFSEEVLSGYPDDYFDWVYIDGNHLYDFVRRDVEIAFDKVRAGGIVAGDDFFWKREGRMHVREAVFDALRARGVSTGVDRIGQQFMIKVEK